MLRDWGEFNFSHTGNCSRVLFLSDLLNWAEFFDVLKMKILSPELKLMSSKNCVKSPSFSIPISGNRRFVS